MATAVEDALYNFNARIRPWLQTYVPLRGQQAIEDELLKTIRQYVGIGPLPHVQDMEQRVGGVTPEGIMWSGPAHLLTGPVPEPPTRDERMIGFVSNEETVIPIASNAGPVYPTE